QENKAQAFLNLHKELPLYAVGEELKDLEQEAVPPETVENKTVESIKNKKDDTKP
ncbi:22667_t:CDS:2, partial [Dentiscutata erythropus]